MESFCWFVFEAYRTANSGSLIVKVLEQEGQGRQKKVKYNSLVPGEDDPVNESGILVHEKRTRFSLSHDQDSIG